MAIKLRRFSRNIIVKIIASFLIALCACGCVNTVFLGVANDINFNSLVTNDILSTSKTGLLEDSENIYNQLILQNTICKKDIAVGNGMQFKLPGILSDNKYEYYIELQDDTIFKSDSVDDNDKASLFEKENNIVIILGQNFDPAYGYGYSFAEQQFDYNQGDYLNQYGASINAVMYDSVFKAVVVRLTDEGYASYRQQWMDMRQVARGYLKDILTYFGFALILFIYLCLVAGRKPEDNEVHLHKIDRMYTDITLVAGMFLVSIFVEVLFVFIDNNGFNYIIDAAKDSRIVLFSSVTVAVTFVVTTLLLVISLSFMRKIKSKKLLKHSLIFVVLRAIFRVCKKFVDAIKKLFDGRAYAKFPLTKRLFYSQIAFIIGSGLLVFIFALFIFQPPMLMIPIVLECILIVWYVTGNNKTFDDINRGFDDSLEERMRAERMKIDLVTNVSHDLKTPLTSIIGYIDLLSKEDGLSETAKDYIAIIAEKSDRLKHIVADLFDIAKATSGDLAIDAEEIDIKKLVEQTIADMQDKIEASELAVKLTLTDKMTNTMTDGKKMYRVLQNVIDNALKYSLKGTRIFVEVYTENDDIAITVKNTASYEMNFSSYDILQRFSRGDQARTTEGNGLGLSIAQSFTDSCGGVFDVFIDGDQFKVVIKVRQIKSLD